MKDGEVATIQIEADGQRGGYSATVDVYYAATGSYCAEKLHGARLGELLWLLAEKYEKM